MKYFLIIVTLLMTPVTISANDPNKNPRGFIPIEVSIYSDPDSVPPVSPEISWVTTLNKRLGFSFTYNFATKYNLTLNELRAGFSILLDSGRCDSVFWGSGYDENEKKGFAMAGIWNLPYSLYLDFVGGIRFSNKEFTSLSFGITTNFYYPIQYFAGIAASLPIHFWAYVLSKLSVVFYLNKIHNYPIYKFSFEIRYDFLVNQGIVIGKEPLTGETFVFYNYSLKFGIPYGF